MTVEEEPAAHANLLPPLARHRQRADEWALVLVAEGMQPTIHRCEDGYRIEVPPHERDRALAILETWKDENPRPPVPIPVPEGESLIELGLAYTLFLALLGLHLYWSADPAVMTARIDAGSSHAARIMSGEGWRVVSALTLHRDAPHAIGNALIGGLFFGSLTRRVGLGVALFGALMSGALGNLANALWYTWSGDPHSSIGASTSVFGIVGVMSGLEVWRRRAGSLTWRRSWVPIGGGLGLLAMLGAGGGRVDFGAHLFGLIAGVGIGLTLSPWCLRSRPGWPVQAVSGALSAAVVVLAWRLAES